jgi:hypothetical protein
VGWNCYRVRVCSLPDLVQILPMRSTVNADATINRAESVKADLKNNILIRSCYIWYSKDYVRVDRGVLLILSSRFEVQVTLMTRVF